MRAGLFAVAMMLAGGDAVGAELPKQLHLATTDWCPYACPNDPQRPGIVHEYLTGLLKAHGVDVQITFYPWARAVALASGGSVDGLLTAVPTEAPTLRFTHVPTMAYSVCFYTTAANAWQYTGAESLPGATIGVIKDYAYGEPVDGFVRDPTHAARINVLTGSEGIKRLFGMLDVARMDAFLDDRNVVAWSAAQAGVDVSRYRNAGCLDENPFYVAIHPGRPWADALIALLDAELAKAENQAKRQQIAERYLQ